MCILIRRWRWLQRVAAARAWQRAERAQAAEHDAAIRRILDQAATLPPRDIRRDH